MFLDDALKNSNDESVYYLEIDCHVHSVQNEIIGCQDKNSKYKNALQDFQIR